MTKPAIVDAKVSIVDAEAGSGDLKSLRYLPPRPRVTIKVMKTGIHAMRSYQLST
jgi:hypothetical protein